MPISPARIQRWWSAARHACGRRCKCAARYGMHILAATKPAALVLARKDTMCTVNHFLLDLDCANMHCSGCWKQQTWRSNAFIRLLRSRCEARPGLPGAGGARVRRALPGRGDIQRDRQVPAARVGAEPRELRARDEGALKGGTPSVRRACCMVWVHRSVTSNAVEPGSAKCKVKLARACLYRCEALKRARDAAGLAADCACTCARGFTTVDERCMPQEIGAEAADMGINVGLEIINRYETNILNTAAQVHAAPPCDTACKGGMGLTNTIACMSTRVPAAEPDSAWANSTSRS